MSTKFKNISQSRWLLLLVIMTGAVGSIQAKSTQLDQQDNIVIKAGSPLMQTGKKYPVAEWNTGALIAKEKELKKHKAAVSGTIAASKTTTIDKDIKNELKKFAKTLEKAKNGNSIAMALASTTTVASDPPKNALILYDYRPTEPYGKLGKIYAIMLRNLLGHFNANVNLIPVDNYMSGGVSAYDATFYIGSYYDSPVPASFLADVRANQDNAAAKTVVWFRFNIWKLTEFSGQGGWYDQKWGWYYPNGGVAGMNAVPTAQNPEPGFYDTVLYKNKELRKYYSYDVAGNQIFADPYLVLATVTNPNIANVEVVIRNAKVYEANSNDPAAETPYVVKSNKFWFIADIPFTYIGPRDRYLVFADILHDILGSNHAEQHRAMIRLEDLNALTRRDDVQLLSDYLSQENIAFSIGVVPHYLDPNGYYVCDAGEIPPCNGPKMEVPLAQALELKDSITYALQRGADLVQHGYTHQYKNVLNPYTGVSGDDFEFWLTNIDGTVSQPIPEATTTWVKNRITSGQDELTGANFSPFAWEMPHYRGAPVAYRAATALYPNHYDRRVYYTSETPGAGDEWAGQFFPYIIEQDYYGSRVLPENLGNIQYDSRNIDPLATSNYTKEDLKTNAEYALVVRDGFASFFYHPFLVESFEGYPDIHGFDDLKYVVESINAMNYQWVGARSLTTP